MTVNNPRAVQPSSLASDMPTSLSLQVVLQPFRDSRQGLLRWRPTVLPQMRMRISAYKACYAIKFAQAEALMPTGHLPQCPDAAPVQNDAGDGDQRVHVGAHIEAAVLQGLPHGIAHRLAHSLCKQSWRAQNLRG